MEDNKPIGLNPTCFGKSNDKAETLR